MGGCSCGDVKGGKQAVGGVHHASSQPNNNNNAAQNDAVDFFFKSRGLQPLFSNIELSLSASKLIDRDITSKSDPMAIMYTRKRDGKLEEVGRTEVVMNDLNPSWIVKITITYHFEMVQPLVFHIYDVDTKFHNVPVKSLELKNQQFLGEASCNLSEIVTGKNQTLTLGLQNKNGRRIERNLGTLTIHAEETVASRTAIELTFSCFHLDNKDMFSRSMVGGEVVPICKTEVVNNNLSPIWKPICLSMQQLGSKENPLLIECLDFNSSGNHVLTGKLQKSAADLEKLYRERIGANFVLPSPHGHEKVLKGRLFVDRFLEKEQYSVLDYISIGFELNFMVAVDFTASNGNPRNPDSLHYIDPSGRLNSYQQAIMEVGEVIQFYDSDRRFPAWGFGGRPSNWCTVSHFCNLNGSPTNSEILDGDNGRPLKSSTGRKAARDIVQFVPMREVRSECILHLSCPYKLMLKYQFLQ